MNEFKLYGPIRQVRVVQDQAGKSRGYGFVEFERERDMKSMSCCLACATWFCLTISNALSLSLSLHVQWTCDW
jgi:hypothetical protein